MKDAIVSLVYLGMRDTMDMMVQVKDLLMKYQNTEKDKRKND
jgi:hypothetical protein